MQVIMDVVSSPASWAVIFSLVILEGLLSADNALVLAVVVKHLPEEQRKKALFYGIMGAYVFRFIAIGLGVYIVKFTWVKILGASYLLWIALKFFIKKNNESEESVNVKATGFWGTVITVELMDITFSVDSILAAFGVSDKVWVLYLGGILGILMMRGVAQLFLLLLEKFPELEATAYILIALIGAKLMGSAFGLHLPEFVFFPVMASVFIGTLVYSHFRKDKSKAEEKIVA
jgi:YkoY family integral membrane protein